MNNSEETYIKSINRIVVLGKTKIKGLHPYTFKCGEWATITNILETTPLGLPKRHTFTVVYDDGTFDSIPLSDVAKGMYEVEV